MAIYDLILIPILLGLVGFFEPCSLGINVIFLNRINALSRAQRVAETTVFTLVRGTVLAVIGLTAAFVGSKIIGIQASLFIILGLLYIILGVLAIVNIYYPLFGHSINLTKYFKQRGALKLGIIFGFVIPACAIALIVALIGRAVLVGNLFEGFVSLLLFGITLSAPLIIISSFEKSNQIIRDIAKRAHNIPWLPGIVLIVIGILTLLTSIWWKGALP